MVLLDTVAGRFLVQPEVVSLVRKLQDDLKAALAANDHDRYRIQRGIFESVLERHAMPVRQIFVTPRSERELAEFTVRPPQPADLVPA